MRLARDSAPFSHCFHCRHCSVAPKSLVVSGTQSELDRVISTDNYSVKRNVSTGEKEMADFHAAFFRLNKSIRGVKSLPLTISDVLGIDPAFRHSQVHPSPPVF